MENWAEVDKTYCGVAATADVVGDRWTMLILRDVLFGVRRFDELNRGLGISTAVLTDRLKKLCEHGILSKVRYESEGRRHRHEYQLTERGVGFVWVQMSIAQFGYDHLVPEGRHLVELYDESSGQAVRMGPVREDGSLVSLEAIRMRINPASQTAARSAD